MKSEGNHQSMVGTLKISSGIWLNSGPDPSGPQQDPVRQEQHLVGNREVASQGQGNISELADGSKIEVSWNRGTKSSILTGSSIISHHFLGCPHDHGNHQMLGILHLPGEKTPWFPRDFPESALRPWKSRSVGLAHYIYVYTLYLCIYTHVCVCTCKYVYIYIYILLTSPSFIPVQTCKKGRTAWLWSQTSV